MGCCFPLKEKNKTSLFVFCADAQFRITETHFTNGSETWTADFASYGMTYRFSRAYFRQMFFLFFSHFPERNLLLLLVEQFQNTDAISASTPTKTIEVAGEYFQVNGRVQLCSSLRAILDSGRYGSHHRKHSFLSGWGHRYARIFFYESPSCMDFASVSCSFPSSPREILLRERERSVN